jgi:hypothetical protein
MTMTSPLLLPRMRPWVLLLVLAVGVSQAAARKAAPPQEDPVALAGLLVREGDWERATQVLASMPPLRAST